MKDSNKLLKNMSTKSITKININGKTSFELVALTQSDTPLYENANVVDYANARFHDLANNETSDSDSLTTPTSVDGCHGHVIDTITDPGTNTNTCSDQPSLLHKSEQNDVIKNGSSHGAQNKVLEKAEILHIPATHFIIGLLVLCCFNLPLGLVALYLSLRAAAAYRDGDNVKGLWYARASIVLSLMGIMLTMMAVSSIVVYIAVNKHNGRKNTKRLSSSALGF